MLSNKLLSSIGNTDQLDVDDVFSAYTYTGNGSTQTINNGIDLAGKGGMVWVKSRSVLQNHLLVDTIRGASKSLASDSTSADNTIGNGIGTYGTFNSTGFTLGSGTSVYGNQNTSTYVSWTFRKAPKFFDVVTYTGNGSGSVRNVSHSLGTDPGLILVKRTDSASSWWTWHRSLPTRNGTLETTNAFSGSLRAINGADSTAFSIDNNQASINSNGSTYVAYLFAPLLGISKVGSYTGNGSSQTINCGFSTGAQFILIKRTDSTGDWYVWDTARGIIAANDPHLSLNTTAAEVTTNDSVDPDSTGFIVNQVAATNINVNGATYIFLSIA